MNDSTSCPVATLGLTTVNGEGSSAAFPPVPPGAVEQLARDTTSLHSALPLKPVVCGHCSYFESTLNKIIGLHMADTNVRV
jgi:hypothetical protein